MTQVEQIESKIEDSVRVEASFRDIELKMEKVYLTYGSRVESAKKKSIKYREKGLEGKKLSINMQYLYGELLIADFLGIMQVIRSKGLWVHKKAGFYDLGSGLGKLVIAAGTLDWIEQSVGIEIVPDIAADAEDMLNKILQKDVPVFLEAALKCILKQGDVLQLTSDWVTADIVFVCATAFTPEFLKRLEKILERLRQGALVLFVSHQMKSICFDCRVTIRARSTYGKVTVRVYKRNQERRLAANLLRGALR